MRSGPSQALTRHTPSTPCPICGGNGKTHPHCHGFLSGDGEWARCSRDNGDGALLDERTSPETYLYRRCDDDSYRPWTKTPPTTPRTVAYSPSTGTAPQPTAKNHPFIGGTRYFLYGPNQRVVRTDTTTGIAPEKTIRVEHRTADGHWIAGNGPGPIERIYLRETLTDRPHDTVFVTEGEAKGDPLRGAGLLTITWRGGSGQVNQAISPLADALTGRDVVLLGDDDAPGRKAMGAIAVALESVVKSVKIIAPYPESDTGRDIEDWLHEGHAVPELLALVDAAPTYQPEVAAQRDDLISLADGGHPIANWPAPLEPEAFHGLAGAIVKAIRPETEADDAALLFQFLAYCGNVIGRHAYFPVEADRHFTNLDVVLVGDSAKGRKGTSEGHIKRVFAMVDEGWTKECITSGLSSGEGVIWACRDPITKTEAIKDKGKPTGEYREVIDDLGVDDKRLLFRENEFASVLKVLQRDGSTLSAIIRQAWDTGDLRISTKNSPAKATGAHISINGHITKSELIRHLDATEAGNGFGNRILWIAVRRARLLPEGGNLAAMNLDPLVAKLREAVIFAQIDRELRYDQAARTAWYAIYPSLSEGKPGLLGAMTARGEPQVMRIATIYALLDCSTEIRKEHLLAGIACWQYAESSARWIFGDRLGDPVADEVLRLLRTSPEGLTRTEMRDLFGRHKSAGQITAALTALAEHHHARRSSEASDGGRPVERWFATAALAA